MLTRMTPAPAQSGFSDMHGNRYEPDPSGRHRYRVVKDGEWTSTVKDQMSATATHDPDGVALCAIQAPKSPQHSSRAQLGSSELPPGVQRWEYKMLKATFGASLEQSLNKAGQYGWELVSISAASGTVTLTGNKIFALLKRPIP